MGVGVVVAGAGLPHLVVVLVAGAAWSFAFGPAPSVFQSAAIRSRAASPEMLGAWINATSNVGIAAGSAMGGIVLESFGIRAAAWTAAALIFLAAATVGVARRAFSAECPT
jgi:predicted MFS family arabinose efflux permease